MKRVCALAISILFALPASGECRYFNGTENNLDNLLWGSAGIQFVRISPADYGESNTVDNNSTDANSSDSNSIDTNSIPAGANRPGTREISNVILAQSESIPDTLGRSDFIWAWAEFIDHDIEHINPAQPSEPFNIPVPTDDPIFEPNDFLEYLRSQYDQNSTPRQQINSTTSWLDGSMIYGISTEEANSLRTFTGGRLIVTSSETGDLLPYNDVNVVGDANLFMAGDDRANENVALLSLHTLFVREHNRLAAQIETNEPNWTDEQVFQKARKIVGAEIQAITYNEFLPAFLDNNEPNAYNGYDPNLNPAASNEFAVAAFKIYISAISPEIALLDANSQPDSDGNLPYEQALFNPQYVAQNGIESILRGLAAQTHQQIDTQIISALRNNFNNNDLAAIAIQQARDHGLPSYNAMRGFLNLEPFTSFAEINADANVQASLETTYEDVNEIDAFVGFLAEDTADSNSTIQKSSYKIIKEQFERLRNADRLWYAIDPNFTADEIAFISLVNLKDIIEMNTDINNLQTNIFFASPANESNESDDSNESDEPNAINDELTINLARIVENPFWFMDDDFLFIAGSSCDFNEANVLEGNSVNIKIFADANGEPVINESIPYSEFYGHHGKIIFKGSEPLISLKFTPCRNTFQILVTDSNLFASGSVTVDIGIGTYLGQGTGNISSNNGFKNAFLSSMNESHRYRFFP